MERTNWKIGLRLEQISSMSLDFRKTDPSVLKQIPYHPRLFLFILCWVALPPIKKGKGQRVTGILQDVGGVIWGILFNLEVTSLNCVSVDYEQKRLVVYEKPLMVTLLLLLIQSATTTVFLSLPLPATQRRIEMSLQVFFFQTLCQRNVRYEKGKLDSSWMPS